MKLSKKKEKELMQVYEAYWAEYLKGNVDATQSLLDDSYTQIGSAESEVFASKKEAVQFLVDTIDQVAGKLEMRNRSTKLEQQDHLILIHEFCDLYALADKKWIFYSKFRASTLLQRKKEGWKITHQHSSFPDTKTEEGQNVAIEKIAEENKDGDDFAVITPLMKKIQQDWKKIGHVPRKDSDKIWKQFKNACNHYFDRLHAEKNEANKEELANFESKETLLKEVEALTLSGDNDADLKLIKEAISKWKDIGRVPYNKKNIDQKFNKVLDGLFGKLKLNKKEVEMIRFENKLNALASQEDDRKLQNEKFFISKKITEIKGDIRQLENNLGFFQHADQNNPLVKEVHNNIKRQKEQLDVWKQKMKKIKSL